MFSFFKKGLQENDIEPKFDIQLIGSVLAYEIARSDGEISKSELVLILDNLKKISKKTSNNPKNLMNIIEKYSENSVSFNQFINDININFSSDEKNELIMFLWEVAYADKMLEINEERLIRRIADLINIKDIKVLKLKNDAKNKI